MTDNVWVPRELLEWMKEQLPNHVALDGETDLYRRAQLSRLLAQPVSNEPVAWQWLNTAHFRRKIPAYANACHWEPLYRHPPAPAIPEGYALVPLEPTPKMIDATWYHPIDQDGGIESQNTRNERIYRAMLSAAPQPTEGSTDE